MQVTASSESDRWSSGLVLPLIFALVELREPIAAIEEVIVPLDNIGLSIYKQVWRIADRICGTGLYRAGGRAFHLWVFVIFLK